MRDAAGKLIEVTAQNVGFREFKMDGGIMKINGERIVFKGVNRHEFDCDRGRAIDPREIEKDIITMKKSNINALRTSHYPNQSRIYDLADVMARRNAARKSLPRAARKAQRPEKGEPV